MAEHDRSFSISRFQNPLTRWCVRSCFLTTKRGMFALLFAGSVLAGCGGDVQPGLISLNVKAPGMHCDGCVETVESTLRKLPGVDSVKADLTSKDVFVRLDTGQTTRHHLDSIITKLGFAEAGE